MVEWSNPSPTQKMVFNPSSDSGFQWLPVKGRVFNYLTQRALVRGENFESVRLNFMSPTNKQYQYFLEDQLLKSQTSVNLDSNSGDYFFVLDLQRLSEVPSIDSSSPIVWEEGTWQLQLVFPYQQKEEETIYLGTPLNDFGSFEIDQLPPIWQWQLKESTGEVLGEADFTNQPITVSISCQDQGSDCVSPLQSFSLVGNFCGDALRCNTQAARDFRVCDSTGNCRTDSLSIRGYDPVPPQLESLLIDNLEAAIATEKPVLSLRYSDPNRVDTQTLPLDFNLQMCDDKNPFFKLDDQGTRCIERQQPCVLTSEYNVWRGDALNGVCEPSCPDGYKYQNDTCQIICGEGAFEADRISLPFNLNINGV
jgi:hypothetical protein